MIANVDNQTTVIPALPGSYALLGALWQPARLAIGRLGEFDFPAGLYIYLGSAWGPGGLRARLRHHVHWGKRPHWHLDALRPCLSLLGGWFVLQDRDLECAWSQSLSNEVGVKAPVLGFGSQDCRSGCKSHLLQLPDTLRQSDIQAWLNSPLSPNQSMFAFDI